jgi:hypothetical protein
MGLDPRVAVPLLQYRGSPAPWAGCNGIILFGQQPFEA